MLVARPSLRPVSRGTKEAGLPSSTEAGWLGPRGRRREGLAELAWPVGGGEGSLLQRSRQGPGVPKAPPS